MANFKGYPPGTRLKGNFETVVTDNGIININFDKVSYEMIAPPFPTKVGSLIKARNADGFWLEGSDDGVSLFSLGDYGWIRLTDSETGWSNDELELVSIEYVPGE
jgi:hypothetical protein